jgi:hypothetical protein
MLVKFTEEERKNKVDNQPQSEPSKIDASDIVSEVSRLRLSEEDLKILEEALLNPPSPNEALIKAAQNYKEKTEEEILKKAEEIKLKRESQESTINENIIETNDKEKQKELLVQMMRDAEEMGLYDEEIPVDLNYDIVEDNTEIIEDTYNISQSIPDNVITPALSDEEVKEMFMDEWERKFDLVEEEQEFSTIEPTEEEEERNFSTITPDNENIFQEEAPKFNIDDSNPINGLDTFDIEVNNSFWRDHLNEESNNEDDLKKK